MTRSLAFSPDLTLPVDAITQTLAFIARKGAGKTYGAAKLAEELLDAGGQVVALDPIGVWYSLRLAADGRGRGFDLPVFGGLHGDLPLVPTAGALLADLLVDKGISAVLDVSQFRKHERKTFATDFAEQLFHRKKAARTAMHLFIEEAQVFVPQRAGRDEARMLGAFEDLVRLGRNFGIGCSLISQRPQSVNKEALTQTECLVVLQTNGAQERAAIRDWVKEHGVERQAAIDALPGLPVGTAYVWSPSWLRVFEKVRIGTRRTYDASATPTLGGRVTAPATLAPVDVETIKAAMAQVVAEAETKDPAALRKRIATLEAELRKAQAARPGPSPEDLERARDDGRREAAHRFQTDLSGLGLDAKRIREQLDTLDRDLGQILAEITRVASAPPIGERTARIRAQQRAPVPAGTTPIVMVSRPNAGEPPLGAERNLLAALAARRPERVTRAELGTLAGYSPNGGTFIKYLGLLRSAGYLDEGADGITASAAGLAAIGPVERIASPADLQALWLSKLGAERKLLEVLLAAAPKPLTRQQLAERSGYEVSGGTFIKYLGILRTNRLLDETREGIRVVATLVEG